MSTRYSILQDGASVDDFSNAAATETVPLFEHLEFGFLLVFHQGYFPRTDRKPAMATIAEFSIPAKQFPLGSIAENHPGVTVELERIIPTNHAIIPYFWVRGTDPSGEHEIKTGFGDHPDVKRVEIVDKAGDGYLFRAEWKPQYRGVMKAITTTEVTLLSGSGTSDQWTFELRADDHKSIANFQQYCREQDIHITLTSLQSLSELQTGTDYNLTEEQRAALILAYNRGYYHTPRETTLEELADELGITGQSVGSRLRRGINRLIGSTLIDRTE